LSDFNSKLAGKLNYYALGYLIGFGKKKRAATQVSGKTFAASPISHLRQREKAEELRRAILTARRVSAMMPRIRTRTTLSVCRSCISNNTAASRAPASLKHFQQ